MSEGFNLGSAEVVRLQGPDARSFAHTQFCSDVLALPANDWQWSAWLDAKGRVRYFFALIDEGDGSLAIWLPLGGAQAFGLELQRFRFRAKLIIERVEELRVVGYFDVVTNTPRWQRHDEAVRLFLDGPTPRLVQLSPGSAIDFDADALKRWRGCDARDGLPLIDSGCAEEFVPQSLDLERLGAVSFRKGCYPGQEIAARLHFRGGNKRGLRVVRWDRHSESAIPGARLSRVNAETLAGTLLYSGVDGSSEVGLAVMSGPAADSDIVLPDGTTVTLQPL